MLVDLGQLTFELLSRLLNMTGNIVLSNIRFGFSKLLFIERFPPGFIGLSLSFGPKQFRLNFSYFSVRLSATLPNYQFCLRFLNQNEPIIPLFPGISDLTILEIRKSACKNSVLKVIQSRTFLQIGGFYTVVYCSHSILFHFQSSKTAKQD